MSESLSEQVHDQAMDALTVVQEQMNAYNRRDLESFCSHFAPDIVTRLYETGEVLSTGLAETRELYRRRFTENPNLYLNVQMRVALDNVVIDRELISGFDGGVVIEALAIHELRAGKIFRASYIRRRVQ